jgi:hypothetical protein
VQEYRLGRINYWYYDQSFYGPVDSEKKMDVPVGKQSLCHCTKYDFVKAAYLFAFSKRLGIESMPAHIYTWKSLLVF